MQFARKPGETVKEYIKSARKLHSKVGGGDRAVLLKEMLAEKLLANLALDGNDAALAARDRAHTILMSSSKLKATAKRLELSEGCSFDDVANAITSGATNSERPST